MSEDILKGLRRKYPRRRLFERHILLEVPFSTHIRPIDETEYIYGWTLAHTSFCVQQHTIPEDDPCVSLFLWSWCGIARIQGDEMLCHPTQYHVSDIGPDADWVLRIVRPTMQASDAASDHDLWCPFGPVLGVPRS